MNQTVVALYSRRYDASHQTLYERLMQYLIARNCRIKIIKSLFDELMANGLIYEDFTEPFEGTLAPHDALAVLSIGGDGTFLDAAKMVLNADIPILGINTGRLGFLSDVAQEKIDEALDNLINGNYRLSNIDVISLYANGERTPVDYAINEFAISKCDNASMLTIHAYIDGDYLTTYWADGLIIATSTGSTAYSLSVGGPIVHPSSRNFVITPIAPHNLNVRPLIVPNSVVIQLRVEGRGANVLTSLDGRNHVMENGCQLRIAKTPFDVKAIQLQGHSFFATLREKLMWGADARN